MTAAESGSGCGIASPMVTAPSAFPATRKISLPAMNADALSGSRMLSTTAKATATTASDVMSSAERKPSTLMDYKPKPVFYGQVTRFFGVELEVDDGGEDCDYAEQLLSITGKRMYIKHDGSLDEGFEMVTHPMTLEYHCRDFPVARTDSESSQPLATAAIRHPPAGCTSMSAGVPSDAPTSSRKRQLPESSTSLKNTGTSWSVSAEETLTSSAGGPVDMAERMIPKSSSAVPNGPLTVHRCQPHQLGHN